MPDQASPTQATRRWSFQDSDLRGVACPLCGGREFRVLATTDRYDMGLTTVGCVGCGLVMTNPQPSGAWLEEFYRDHYREVYQRVEKPSLEYIAGLQKDVRAAKAAAFLDAKGVLRDGMVVLDIGASEGCILKAIRDVKPGARAVAVEPNPVFGEFARGHAGCELYPAVENLPVELAGRVDLVVMNHVLEHIGDPVAFLRGLKRWLAPGGALYIDVPDVERYRGLETLHIAHLYHFSARSFRAVMQAAGFDPQVLEVHTPAQHPESLRTLALPGRAGAPAIAPGQEGWAQVLRLERKARRHHRHRWHAARGWAHWLRALRRSALPDLVRYPAQ